MSIITKTTATTDLKSDIKKLIQPIVGDIASFIRPTDRVLLKPNFNTADPFPGSTAMDFLQAVIEIISEANPKEIIVGESCTYFLNTEKVCRLKGAPAVMGKFKVTWHNFENGDWVKVNIPGGKYFKSIKVPKITQEVDKLITLPCLKTHFLAAYTGALKINIGMLKPSMRGRLHLNHLQERVAEVASVLKPDLIIMDGRKCFTEGGPGSGKLETPNILLSGNDMVSVDIEGIKILQSYKANNMLGTDPWALGQIVRAKELGLGARSETDYQVMAV
ncbi:MAG: DUF362 domain-containing protein [Candidatus Parcubacteria bacterium]|nr:DUF362 domain-containing protein [Candidatus Parcubacteria bacterium]